MEVVTSIYWGGERKEREGGFDNIGCHFISLPQIFVVRYRNGKSFVAEFRTLETAAFLHALFSNLL